MKPLHARILLSSVFVFRSGFLSIMHVTRTCGQAEEAAEEAAEDRGRGRTGFVDHALATGDVAIYVD